MKFEYLIYLLPVIFIIGASLSKPKKITQKKKENLQPGDIVEGSLGYPYYGVTGGFTYMRFPKNFSQLGDSLKRFFLPIGFNHTLGSVGYWFLITILIMMLTIVFITNDNNNYLIFILIVLVFPICTMILSGIYHRKS